MSIAQLNANYNDVKSGKRKTQKQLIHSWLFGEKPLSIDEIVKATGFKLPTVVGRLSELATDGLVIEQEVNGLTYYSYNYSLSQQEEIKKKKAEAKTKRLVNAVLKDADAIEILKLILNK